MGRSPCCDKQGLKKGPWTPEEDKILVNYIQSHGHGSWRSLPKLAGLMRCGKSCRLRWTNYLRPDIKRGPFTPEEQKSIIQLHGIVGNKWSTIAAQLPGRTDNEIKNYWNTHLKKQLLRMGLNPDTYASNASPCSSPSPSTRHMAQWESARLEAEARLSRESLLFSSSSNSASASSSTPSSSTALSASNSTLFTSKPEPDFFLRIWHSEVGDAFRKTLRESVDSSPDSSSTKQSFAVVAPAVAEGERREETESKICGAEAGAAAAGSDSSSSYGVEEDASEETYRLYLDFTSDDMALFQGHMAGFSLFSDLNEASLDTAFK